MDWNTAEGLSAIIRHATWWIAGAALITGLFTVVAIIADKKRETLSRNEDTAKRREIEELRSKNLALEKALSPRLVGIKMSNDGKSNIDSLKVFAGMEVVLASIADEVLAGGEAPDDNFPGLLRIIVGFKPQPVELLAK